ncbi:MAG: ChaN family lipoprotein [Desulfobacula sp.]|jgi:uncharacterized iron-regulated protein|nr:ChaN family lipoprotein [Desulfobacula sp.]
MNQTYLISVTIITLCLILLQSCAGINTPAVRQDTLIGKIINVRAGETIEFDTLINTLKDYDVIYLSEKHDNPEHHAMQQRVIRRLIEMKLAPTIGFEFFSWEDTSDILNFLDSARMPNAEEHIEVIEKDLRKKLGWDSQSDDLWKFYYDLLYLAREKGLMAAGLDIPGTLKKRITRKSIEGLTPIEKDMIFSTGLSDEIYKDYMFSVFRSVHCGMAHEAMQTKLYDTWLARNDRMAHSITQLKQYHKNPLVVIIGGGHTRHGLGVIDRVSAINPELSQVNLSLSEIRVNPALLSDYLAPLDLKGYKKQPPADFIYFTQRISYEDFCITFKKQLTKMKKKHD